MIKLIQNKGITLIVLIITIIVLLILVGVTINTLLGENGLITQTIKAEQETKKAEYREKINLIIQEEKISRMTEEKQDLFIDGITEIIKKQEWQETVTISNNEFKEPQNNGEKTIIIVNTKDGYEIIIKVDNIKIEAEIISIIKGKAKTYTVTYNANNGTSDKTDETVREGFSTEVIANTYQRDGYEFVGWSTDKNATEIEYVQGNIIENITEDVNLYAIWSKTTVTITFNGNNITSTQIVSKGVNTPLKEFSTTGITKEGYAFIGWSETENGEVQYEDGVEIIITQDINLYAVWEEDSVSASLSITNGNSSTNDLTKGTTISIQVASTRSEISSTKLEMIKDGTIVAKIYENLSGGKEQNIILDGLEEDLINLDKLTICDTYDCKLTSTTESGAVSEQVISLTDYTVSTANDLNVLASNVNNGAHYSGKTIVLLNDVTTTQNYIPIGYYDGTGVWTGPYFAGIFDGNEYSITLSSMTTSSLYKSSGIFGMIIGGNVSDLKVNGNNNSSTGLCGGIVGGIKNGSINNCVNNCNILDKTKMYNGGIVGTSMNSTITNCTNTGTVYAYSSAGGIAGRLTYNSNVTDCISIAQEINSYGIETLNFILNGSQVSTDTGVTGGIVGTCDASNITNCINKNILISYEGNEKGFNGGIAGIEINNSNIELCRNLGVVNCKNGGAVGGIAGCSYISDIIKCYNNASVNGITINETNFEETRTASNCGGIVGYGLSVNINNCYNLGKVQGVDRIGGIAGIIWYNGTTRNKVNNCYSGSNQIIGDSSVGGLIGDASNIDMKYFSWCTDTNAVGNAEGTNTVSDYTVYTQLQMSTTDNLLNLLNQGEGSGIWARSNSINNGYPYLIENTP